MRPSAAAANEVTSLHASFLALKYILECLLQMLRPLKRVGQRFMFTAFGIESSCDDTAMAVVSSSMKILAQCASSSPQTHAPFGGVVPVLAARDHEKSLPLLADQLLGSVDTSELDAVAVTNSPGLGPCLRAGVTFARQLSSRLRLPLYSVNHLEAHALVPMIEFKDLRPPYLVLLVSGGHCILMTTDSVASFNILGSTLDDAVGEAFDKVARLLDLPLEGGGGRSLEEFAAQGNAAAVDLPLPLRQHAGLDFSFSGLKAAVARYVKRVHVQPPCSFRSTRPCRIRIAQTLPPLFRRPLSII